MSRVLAFTVTRASTPQRARLFIETVTKGLDTAGMQFDWIVYANAPLGADTAHSMCNAGLIKEVIEYPVNVGQHLPTNDAIHRALDGYDYLIRIDEDVEWETKRWLVKLVEAAKALKDKAIVSPLVKGLNNPPERSEPFDVEGLPMQLVFGAIGGICRLHPMPLFKEHPYLADVRWPMGFGDATGIAKWAEQTMTPLIYTRTVKVRHALTTKGQQTNDPTYHRLHHVLQVVPYIPAWQA